MVVTISSKNGQTNYDAKFDDWWAALRKMTFEKQKALGWIPKDSLLNPFAKGIQKWDDIIKLYRKFQSRLIEIYAGFLEHTDVQYGKVVDEIERQGLLDNALIL